MAVFKKQGVYWIDYYVNGHRKRERIGPDKRLAGVVLKSARWRLLRGGFWTNSGRSPRRLMSWPIPISPGSPPMYSEASRRVNAHGTVGISMPSGSCGHISVVKAGRYDPGHGESVPGAPSGVTLTLRAPRETIDH